MTSLTIHLHVGPGTDPASDPTITFTPGPEVSGTTPDLSTSRGPLPAGFVIGTVTVSPADTLLSIVGDQVLIDNVALLDAGASGTQLGTSHSYTLEVIGSLPEADYTIEITSKLEPEAPDPGDGMLATISFADGTFSFAEVEGTELSLWMDPRGAFTLTRCRCSNAEVPDFWVDFVRSEDGQWASVEFRYGSAGQTGNLAEYSVTITGDFTGQATTPAHWWGARWRMSGNQANGLRPGGNDWPYEMTDYATLVAEHLIPAYDPTQTGTVNTVSAVLPTSVTPYTPMGSSSYMLQQGAGGGRSDIGLFSDWDGSALCALASNAGPELVALREQLLANVRTLAEAAASIPIAGMDSTGTAQYDVVNLAPPGGAPGTQSTIEALVHGPPDSTQHYAQGAYLADSVTGGCWWMPATVQLDASGQGSAWVKNYEGAGPEPKGEPRLYDDPNTADCTFAWGDISAWSPSSPWMLDTSHQPETGYVAYILWRDPYDLDTCQRCALCAAHMYGGNWKIFQVRQAAWDYRSALLACAATPDEVPEWLLPRATFETWLVKMQDFIIANAIDGNLVQGGEPLRQVFHCLEAAQMQNGYDITDTAGTPVVFQWAIIMPWQNSYQAQAAAFAVYQRPDDAKARKIATFSLQHLDDQSSGKTGWPPGELPMYYMAAAAQGGPPFFRSWRQAWDYNCPIVHNTNSNGEIMPIPPDYVCPGSPETPQPTPYNCNYSNEFWTALSLALQAGLTEFKAARDWWAAPCFACAYIEQSRALSQV